MGGILLVSQNAGDLALPNIEMKRFPDGENYVRVADASKCRGQDVVILQRCYPGQDSGLVQLLLMLRAVKEQGPKCIRAVVPYLPYARQDKIWKEGESPSAKLVCDMIAEAGCTELVTFDCHFLKKAGEAKFGNLQINSLSMAGALKEYARRKCGAPLFVSPDMGAAYLVEGNGKSMKKVRGEYIEGKTAYREVKSLEADFEMKGKDVVIIDDMIAGGGTMIRAVGVAREKGARKVLCCATHGLLLDGALAKLKQAGAEEVFCSDSIIGEAAKVRIGDGLKAAGII